MAASKALCRGVSRPAAAAARAQARGLTSGRVRVSEEVAQAVHEGKPVVALESTIISHGMPYPENASTARSVEAAVREEGAVPATVFIGDGKLCVGASDADIERLAEEGAAGNVGKCSRRDIAVALASGKLGATTVASTMIGAHAAGIEVFATGGIGGVHRGVADSWDISADLTELSRTPVTVVCAGVKSILDIPKTLEVLETLGVPVAALGQSRFPAFFTRDAGVDAPLRVDTPEELAAVIAAARDMGLDHGFVLGVPNPEPADAGVIDAAITKALADAKAAGVSGKAATPFLLRAVTRATEGASLRSNIALVLNNARTGARLASAVARTGGVAGRQAVHGAAAGHQQRRSFSTSSPAAAAKPWPESASMPAPRDGGNGPMGRIVVLGSTLVDVVARRFKQGKLDEGTSNPGSASLHLGGVGRNIAECAARLGSHVALSSSVGKDSLGQTARLGTEAAGVHILDPFESDSGETASYTALLHGDGEMMSAVADSAVIEAISPEEAESRVRSAMAQDGADGLLVLDAGLTPDAILMACATAAEAAVRGEGVVSHAVPPRSLEALMRSAGIDPSQQAKWDEDTQQMMESLKASVEERKHQFEERSGYTVAADDAPVETPVWDRRGLPVVIEPVSVEKARRVGLPAALAQAAIVTPNAAELHAMADAFREAAAGTAIGELEPPEVQAMQRPGENEFRSPLELNQMLEEAQAAMEDGRGEDVGRLINEMLSNGRDVEGNPLPQREGLGFADMAREAGLDQMSLDDLRKVGAITEDAERYMEAAGMSEMELENAFEDFKRAMADGTLEQHLAASDSEDDGSDGDSDEQRARAMELFAQAGSGDPEEGHDTVEDEEMVNLGGGMGAGVPGQSAAGPELGEHMNPQLLGAAQVVLAAMCNPAVEMTGVGLVEGRKHVLVTLGPSGVLWVSRRPAASLEELMAVCNHDFLTVAAMDGLDFRFIRAAEVNPMELVNVTGAGDSLVGGLTAALQAGYPMAQAIYWGMASARLSLKARPAVAPQASSREALVQAVREVCEVNASNDDEALALLDHLSFVLPERA
ncbi:hypothetical protein FNF27_03075 [Cafeteria roenbergensis]|uniref:Carbohydrate kinase PfkB domain-containing protein n=2 Tax=Cafeteria roenbergensis TaxID=33653 RepID=A0A5A8DTS3_CAFRO|nr:hypothetical protein FNF29_05076 [Cafeteria roenbergensis]KAA0167201.1 hypothetical protein FNF31_01087 [Cafeteria roenbergensis]KAA0175375.1 hypothetical protein FNF27_03075 [Cafeteria roenbergensis]|eukprot:KAA0150739.1 hypothetical protein FNF29_05076 [Cafeteria roenbergensis]